MCTRSFAHGAKSLCADTKMNVAADLAFHLSLIAGIVNLLPKNCVSQIKCVGLTSKKISYTHNFSPFIFLTYI